VRHLAPADWRRCSSLAASCPLQQFEILKYWQDRTLIWRKIAAGLAPAQQAKTAPPVRRTWQGRHPTEGAFGGNEPPTSEDRLTAKPRIARVLL